MMITYAVTNEICSSCGINRISYGIDAHVKTDPKCKSTVIASIKNITFDKSKLDALVKQCNALQLSLVHLYDVIEDLIIN